MNFSVLEYVLAVAREQNFTQAAKKMFIAQSSLSYAIQSLERELNVKLFLRTRSSVVLTPEGKLFTTWASATLHSMELMTEQLGQIATLSQSILRIGMATSYATRLMPEVIQRFQEHSPNCRLTIVEATGEPLWKQLEQGDLDLVLGTPSELTSLTWLPLVHEPMLICFAPSAPFLNSPYTLTSLADILTLPLVLIDDRKKVGRYGIYEVVQALYREHNAAPRVALTCNSLEAAYNAVRQGIGIGVFPALYVRGTDSGLQFFQRKFSPASRIIAISYRKDRVLTPMEQLLIQLLEESCKEIISTVNGCTSL